jgi:hypothetical protein
MFLRNGTTVFALQSLVLQAIFVEQNMSKMQGMGVPI